jgi:putative oxygen-independent coproporphyrinogen III oxidase
MSAIVPLALYVHLPWCVAKCPYCDFVSHAVPRDGLPERQYLDALEDDLEFAAAPAQGREVISVFFGGGTPSLFSAESIDRILARARAALPFAPDAEVTLEANPGTVEHARFREYRAAGVNRVSLGAQSFEDRNLARLGRIHSRRETYLAVDELRAAGLENFNLDLMYALPEQDIDGAVRDVERAIELEPAHISHYQLTLEPGTAFSHRPPPLPSHDAGFDMQLECQRRLAEAGYVQYEVSAYARPGAPCRHNLNYWSFGDYLGVGVGAHGKLTDSVSGEIVRTGRVKSPSRYLTAPGPFERIAEMRPVPVGERVFEFCLNALRLVDGFEWSTFEARTGLSRDAAAEICAACARDDLLEPVAGGGWRPTGRGFRYLNDLQARFLT